MNAGWLSLTQQLAGDWAQRLWRARGWCTTQVVGLALLFVAGIGWTRIAEKHWWQVLFTLLIPVLLLALFLLMQAGTVWALVRRQTAKEGADSRRVSIAWGAATLLLWIVVAWAAWWMLDKFDDQITLWAGYLNSRFGAGARAKIATEEHIAWLLNYVERTLRWVILPGLLMPLMGSAAWGLRLPWRRVLRAWLNWRWWPGVLGAVLIGVAWPVSFFAVEPHGSVTAQVWRVALKLLGAYLLAILSWVAVLAWGMTLLCSDGAKRRDEDSGDLLGAGVRVDRPSGGKSNAVSLPLPENGEGGGGNA